MQQFKVENFLQICECISNIFLIKYNMYFFKKADFNPSKPRSTPSFVPAVVCEPADTLVPARGARDTHQLYIQQGPVCSESIPKYSKTFWHNIIYLKPLNILKIESRLSKSTCWDVFWEEGK